MARVKKSIIAPVLVLILVVGVVYLSRLSSSALEPKNEQSLTTSQSTLSKISVVNLKLLAKDLGIDSKKFNMCLDEGSMSEKIKAQLAEAKSLGVSEVPLTFVNGIKIGGTMAESKFETVIDAELRDGSGEKVDLSPREVTRVAGIPYGEGNVRGSKDARVKLMVFNDISCVFCNGIYRTIDTLLAKYGNDISVEYRIYFLPEETNSVNAAQASLCAGEQGKFLEMNDRIIKAMTE